MAKLVGIRKAVGYYLAESPARLLARTSVTPNVLTWFGFLLAVGGAVLIAVGQLLAAGLVVLFAGFCDILDGALARLTDRATLFGAVLDSTLDRLSEAVLLLGIMVLYAGNGDTYLILLVAVTLVFSLLVSYIRARAETMGVDCQVGFFTRGERVILLVLGLCLSPVLEWALPVALLVVLLFSFVTVIQRLVYVWQRTRAR
jgi:CDP-diacylglycerol--glycerol-3-phosphate 3-phosphatidyltransferase